MSRAYYYGYFNRRCTFSVISLYRHFKLCNSMTIVYMNCVCLFSFNFSSYNINLIYIFPLHCVKITKKLCKSNAWSARAVRALLQVSQVYCARSWHSFCRCRHLEASDFDKWPGQQSLLISCPFPRPVSPSAPSPLMCTFLLLPQTGNTCDENPLNERMYGPLRCDLLTLIIEIRTLPPCFIFFCHVFPFFYWMSSSIIHIG